MTDRKPRKKNVKPAGAAVHAPAGVAAAARAGAAVAATGPFSRTTLRARLALLTLGAQQPRADQR